MTTGPTGPASALDVWKSGSIGVTGSTVSSFRNYGGFLGGATTALGPDENLIALREQPAEEIKRLSNLLKTAKYLKSATSKYNRKLGDAYIAATSDYATEKARTGRPDLTFEEFLLENAETGGDRARIPTGTVRISTPTQAAALIESRFKAELGRMPTPEELEDYSKRLRKRESKKSAITVGRPKVVDGVVVTEYTGGFEKDQFINNIIRKSPEYKQKLEQAKNLTRQELAKVAAANGLDLNKDFGASVDGWIKQVEGGTDIDVIKNTIRQTARLGMPDRVAGLIDQGVDLDTIYAPYKKVMASVLELNPDSITLNDPTLRGAIGPDREMTLYDFQRSLRKDPRWQYTDNAREEVSSAALKVLQDFGFQG